MALFSTSEVVTAAKLNSLGIYAEKTADESRTSNTVLTNDTHLSITIPAIGTYIIEFWLYGVSAANAAGDIQVAFTFPTGTCHASGIGPDASLASGNAVIGQFGVFTSIPSGTQFNAYGLSTGTTLTYLQVRFAATATGTFRLQWAQAATSVSASTLKAGSSMLARRVA